MTISLKDHFDYKRLLLFVIPSIIMMIFTSFYGVVDGLFVSNFAGKTALAGVNFIWPVVMIAASPGFLFGTGGGAVVGKILGEKDPRLANRVFSLFVYLTIIIGIVIGILGIIFMPNISYALGARGDLLKDTIIYGRICLIALPLYMVENAFQILFVTAEKPKTGMLNAVFAGIANIFFDFLFIVVFKLGILGSALGTSISMAIGGIFPLIYFSRNNNSLLRLGKTSIYKKHILKAITNGSSELVSNISMSLVSSLYNVQLLKVAGEEGVAAYGVLMYVNFFFISIFIGYCVGIAPIVSYNFGAKNNDELKNIFSKSLRLIIPTCLTMFLIGYFLSYPISYSFVGYNKDLLKMTTDAFKIHAFSYAFVGIAMFAPSFFTALNNGIISAIISFARTLVFQVSFVLILPKFLYIDGIWLSLVFAELLSLILALIFLISKRKLYGYTSEKSLNNEII